MNPIKTAFILLFVLVHSSIFGLPTSFEIKGTISDSATKQNLQYVNITLLNQADLKFVTGTVTEANGKFRITNVVNGEYVLTISFIGYTKKEIKISNINQVIDLGIILLQSSETNLKEVTITGKKIQTTVEFEKKVFSIGDIPNSQNITAIEALRNISLLRIDINDNISLPGVSEIVVLIDGKQTSMNYDAILKQLPANTIDKIEVISTPSARFDSEGNYAIINVIFKKKLLNSLNGNLRTSLSCLGNEFYGGGSFLLNHSLKNTTIFWGLNYHNAKSKTDYNLIRETQNYVSFNESSVEKENSISRYAQFIIDHSFKKFGSLSLSTFAALPDENNFTNAQYSDFTAAEKKYYYNIYTQKSGGYFQSVSADYQKIFNDKGQQLNISFVYSYSDRYNKENNEGFLCNSNWNILSNLNIEKRSSSPFKSEKIFLNFNYLHPLKNSKVELGCKYLYRPKHVNYNFDTLDNETNNWMRDFSISNDLNIKRDITSGYINYSFKLFKINIKTGVRTEISNRLINQSITDYNENLHQVDWFPFISISGKIFHTDVLQFSFRKSYSQPEEYMINPLPVYLRDYNVSKGNPDLRPEFYNSTSIYYNREKEKYSIDFTLFYRETINPFTSKRIINGNNITETYTNAKKYSSLGIEINSNITIFKWLSIVPNLSLYQYQIEGGSIESMIPDNTFMKSVGLTTYLRFKNLRINLFSDLTDKKYYASYVSKAHYDIGLSAQYTFLQNKATIRLVAYSFIQNHYSSYSTIENLDLKSNSLFYPSIKFEFVYKINNYKSPENFPDSDINNSN